MNTRNNSGEKNKLTWCTGYLTVQQAQANNPKTNKSQIWSSFTQKTAFWIVYISIFHYFKGVNFTKMEKNPFIKQKQWKNARVYCIPFITVSRKILFRPLLQYNIKIMVIIFTADTFSVSVNRLPTFY